MSPQLIQKMAQIDSQVEFELTTASKVSGLLKEIGSEHVLLDTANGPITILVDSIISVQSLVNVNDFESPANTPDLDNQINTSDLTSSKSNEIKVLDSANLPPTEIETSEDTDVNTKPTSSVPGEIEASDDADANTESTDLVSEEVKESHNADASIESTDAPLKEIEESDNIDANTESEDSIDFEEQASEQLDEIDKRFKNEIEGAKIELIPPDFTFPANELQGWQNSDIAGKWLQIKNKYENAQRINELSTKFGRIQPLLIELTPLVRRFRNSPSLKRAFAYFNALSHPDDWQKTIHTYQEVAITSDDSNDWFNVAVSALNLNKEELACYSLEKFFHGVSVIDAPDAWYVYVSLIEKFNNLSAFRELCKKDENDVVEDEIEVLLDAAIYLLKKKIAAEFAIEIVQRQIKGESAESLLKEVCQKLCGQSAASYRQFLSQFMNDRIAAEEKIRPTTPEPIHPLKRSTPDAKQYEIQTKWMQNNLSNALYRSAEQEDQNGNLEEAERLYQDCIDQDIKRDSAIKNLAMVLVRLGRSAEAVGLLEDNRQKVKDKRALDNVLIAVYPAAAQYEKAIDLLNEALKQAQDHERRSRIRMQIANTYIKLEDYVNAEGQLRRVQKLRPQNITVQRNLAFCLSKQNRYDEAKQILNKIPSAYPAPKTRELLEAIERAQRTGKFNLDEDTIIEIETVLSYFSGELSDFTQFFLNRCAFDGVAPERVSEGKYTGSDKDFRYDISRLEDVAKQLGTRRPRDRGHYYLSAARIYFDLGGNQNLFYRYLCRSFASRGDAAVSENKHLDTVKEWYCEALTAYDGDKTRRRRDEQDAVNSLVRYLYSTLGPAHIDLTPNTQTFDKVVRDVINNHPEKKKVFDAIAYLVLHSRFAADRVLNRLYGNETLRTMAVEYLKEMDIEVPDVMKRLVDFVHPWNELRNKKSNADRDTSDKLRLLNNFDLTTSWLEDNIRFAEDIRSSLSFELDRQRVGELQRILESALELCKQVTFEERERLCFQLHSFCQDLLRDIEESPTKVSVEDVYPITEAIQDKVDAYLNELYEASKPQLNLRLPVESYVPDTDRQIEVQIVLENERGRSPAESLELIVQEDKTFFMVTESKIKQNESLRGGEQSILTVPLRVTPHALQSQTFSLSLCAQYRTRTEEQLQTPIQDLSIRLYSEDEFEKIENPYAAYAEGGIVGDTNMFFGREELIQNIAQAIRESRTQSKSVMVFGQKRSGKSSVLYHLKESLREDTELLILDLGNMSTLLDQHAQTSLLHQFLNGILRALERAIQRKQRDGLSSLELAIPGREFYDHPAPLQLFEDTFVRLKDLTADQTGQEDWRGVRVVLLIDEFQYIYEPIIKGEIPDLFMQNWKALLQANYFSAVLVGQDVMQKFKLRFPNEFGTMQDERVTYLKEEDARELIDEPIRIGGRQGDSRYREQAIERILDLTAGSPFYIQIICNRLVDYMNVKRAGLVTEADVEQVKNELIHDVNALGLDKFDNLINSGDTSPDAISDEDALKILKTIADNSNRTDPCHRDKIVCETNLPIDTILDDLVNRDVVKRRDQSYQIQVGLFKEWFVVNG
ncbi:MAG: tetratricopeptide repeat protein [Candidatus Poribacteria bacterium]|nr:tetratricopeptide repeat protein [Candidatus Poribacteria bacterium]